MENKTILIIDDDPLIRKILETKIKSLGYETIVAEDGETGLKELEKNKIDLVLCDIFMPKINGYEVLKRIKNNYPDDLLVIIMTAFANIETAVTAMKMGAFDYLIKPFTMDEIPYLLNRTFAFQDLFRRSKTTQKSISKDLDFSEITGASIYTKRLHKKISSVIKNKSDAIIIGENGTGKRFIADTISKHLFKKYNPITINLAIHKREDLGNILFGNDGLLNDIKSRAVIIENSNLLTFELQSKLLTAMKDLKEKNIIFIFISSKPKNRYELEEYFIEEIRDFFKDNIIETIPLREHKEDIPLYIESFIKKYNKKYKKQVEDVDKETLYFLIYYSWPNNIEELEMVIENAVFNCEGKVITPTLLYQKIVAQKDFELIILNPRLKYSDALKLAKDEVDKHYFKIALTATNNNKTRAAKMLGISLRQFQYRAKSLGL